MAKKVVIGLGNPLLTDDGVGIVAARALQQCLFLYDVQVLELSTGGLALMEAMSGYEEAVIIDAMVTGKTEPGCFQKMSISDLPNSKNSISYHDMDLPMAIEMGRVLGISLPDKIHIWGIEAQDVETFGHELTPEVKRAVPMVVKHVLEDLGGQIG